MTHWFLAIEDFFLSIMHTYIVLVALLTVVSVGLELAVERKRSRDS